MMDYAMPYCDGPSATRAIHEYLNENAAHATKPFICCMTAYLDSASKKKAYAAGMDYYIEKLLSHNYLK